MSTAPPVVAADSGPRPESRRRTALALGLLALALPFAYGARADRAQAHSAPAPAPALALAANVDGYDRPHEALDDATVQAISARTLGRASRDFERVASAPDPTAVVTASQTALISDVARTPVSVVSVSSLRRPALASQPKPKSTRKSGSQWHSERWVRPGYGRFTSGFKFRWGRWHKGIDLAAPYGSPIVAAADGVVIFVGPASGFGRLVLVRHSSSVVTAYGHMSAFRTHVGAHVHAGELIALIGSAGHSTGPHLHFEVRINGSQVNPVPYLRQHGVYI